MKKREEKFKKYNRPKEGERAEKESEDEKLERN
jgi:hypothetical protein